MLPEEHLGSPAHGGNIEFPVNVPDLVPEDGRGHGTVQDAISVNLSDRTEAGVKVSGNLFGRKDADVRGEETVQRRGKGCCGNFARGLEVCDMAQGMNAGIGPAGGSGLRVLSGQ